VTDDEAFLLSKDIAKIESLISGSDQGHGDPGDPGSGVGQQQ
jgi:hypothetical protein